MFCKNWGFSVKIGHFCEKICNNERFCKKICLKFMFLEKKVCKNCCFWEDWTFLGKIEVLEEMISFLYKKFGKKDVFWNILAKIGVFCTKLDVFEKKLTFARNGK